MKYYLITYKNNEIANCVTIAWLKMLTNLRRIRLIEVWDINNLGSKKLIKKLLTKKELRAYVKEQEDENR